MNDTYTVKQVKELSRGDVYRDQFYVSPVENRIVKRVDKLHKGIACRVFYVDGDGVGGYEERPSTYLVYVVNRVQV